MNTTRDRLEKDVEMIDEVNMRQRSVRISRKISLHITERSPSAPLRSLPSVYSATYSCKTNSDIASLGLATQANTAV